MEEPTAYFDHEKLTVYQRAIEFVGWADDFLSEVERRAEAKDHLSRASASVPVNIAEGNAKWSKRDRSRYQDTAYGSALECAACLDVLVARGCAASIQIEQGRGYLIEIVSMLVGLKRHSASRVSEPSETYGGRAEERGAVFDHEKLRVYQTAREFVSRSAKFESELGAPRQLSERLDRSSTSVVLNIAEGNGRFSAKDRVRFIDIASTSTLQYAACLDVLVTKGIVADAQVPPVKRQLRSIAEMLIAWRRSLLERTEEYESSRG